MYIAVLRLALASAVALARPAHALDRHAGALSDRVCRRGGAGDGVYYGVAEELGADDGRGDALQAHSIVGFLANWIVDAAQHLRHADHVAGDLCGKNVAIVAVGDGNEGIGSADARAPQHVFIGAVAEHRVPFREIPAEPIEKLAILIDDLHIVAFTDQQLGQGRAYAAAAQDDDVHASPPLAPARDTAPCRRQCIEARL